MRLVLKLFIALGLACSCAMSFAQIPNTRSANGISYITGGVGEGEAKAILAEQKQWPLLLEFSQLENGKGVWIFGAMIRITDAKQQFVFDAQADGPYMLINLSPGEYALNASYQGVSQKRTISIKSDQNQKITLSWQ
ncbi:hypothetical protein [Polynucleobacter meluiroseus]|uniref:hypothetical protein n=1 Tax=Polynucleobacter meluiroseus TaxID=1938814 RepID=UPI000BBC4CC7|nr:hypothetical protein [Polynucleobacter meluiroseus]